MRAAGARSDDQRGFASVQGAHVCRFFPSSHVVLPFPRGVPPVNYVTGKGHRGARVAENADGYEGGEVSNARWSGDVTS